MQLQNDIKLCFVISSAYPLFNKSTGMPFGGAELDLYNLAVKFAGMTGYNVEFLLGDYGQKKVEYHKNVKVKKIRYHHVLFGKGQQGFIGSMKGLLGKLNLFFELMKNDSDIFFNECGGGAIGTICIAMRLRRRGGVVFRLAANTDTDPLRFKRDGKPLLSMLYDYGLRKSDVIITQSRLQQDILYKKTGLRSIVIKNGHFINPSSQSFDKRHILWVARAAAVKRPELFLELAERLPEESFVMIMPGSMPQKEDIIARSKKAGNVTFIDFVHITEIQEYFDRARLFVNTSISEGFPNTFIQACLGSSPLLSFMVDPDGIIMEFDLGCLCNDSIDEAVNFIKNLDGKSSVKYGCNALRYVMENHDIERVAEQYEEIFKSIAVNKKNN